jgi:hypothetical protein
VRRFAFHPEALLEFRDAATFYEQRKPGLGARFSVEVERVIEAIVEAPLRWPLS